MRNLFLYEFKMTERHGNLLQHSILRQMLSLSEIGPIFFCLYSAQRVQLSQAQVNETIKCLKPFLAIKEISPDCTGVTLGRHP